MCRVAHTYQVGTPIVILPCHGIRTIRQVAKASVAQLECAVAWLGEAMREDEKAYLTEAYYSIYLDAVYQELARRMKEDT